MRYGLARWALAVVLPTAACDQAVPPPVAQRQLSIDADDVAVMKGLLDSRLRAFVAESTHEEHTPGAQAGAAKLLLIDTTVARCAPNAVPFDTPPGGCLDGWWMGFVAKAFPASSAVIDTRAFEARNVGRLPIRESLGDDVVPISATLVDSLPIFDLLRQHPPGSAVVTFSAPLYSGGRSAVIAFRVLHARGVMGAARLERTASGQWVVAADGFRGGVEATRN